MMAVSSPETTGGWANRRNTMDKPGGVLDELADAASKLDPVYGKGPLC